MQLKMRIIKWLLGFYIKRVRLNSTDLIVFCGHDVDSLRQLAAALVTVGIPMPILVIDDTVADVRRLADLPEEVKNRIKSAL